MTSVMPSPKSEGGGGGENDNSVRANKETRQQLNTSVMRSLESGGGEERQQCLGDGAD